MRTDNSFGGQARALRAQVTGWVGDRFDRTRKGPPAPRLKKRLQFLVNGVVGAGTIAALAASGHGSVVPLGASAGVICLWIHFARHR